MTHDLQGARINTRLTKLTVYYLLRPYKVAVVSLKNRMPTGIGITTSILPHYFNMHFQFNLHKKSSGRLVIITFNFADGLPTSRTTVAEIVSECIIHDKIKVNYTIVASVIKEHNINENFLV